MQEHFELSDFLSMTSRQPLKGDICGVQRRETADWQQVKIVDVLK